MGWIKSVRRGVTFVTLGVAGGAAIVTVRHLLRTPQPLESVLKGEARIDRKHGGDLFYDVAGPAEARTLVLLHDFYPGASNFEFRAIFQPLARNARVFAPDWLGFGMSERPNLAYTGEFYANTLAGFLRDVVKTPATVVAHGLAANIAARAASDYPQLFERLVLVSPVATAGEGAEPTIAQTVVQTAQRFSLGVVPYALIATRPVLKRIAGGPAADEERVDHLYASAHQFGGHFAPLALLSGELDLPIRNILPLLEPPLLIVSGEQDPQRPREAMEDLAVLNPHADLDVIANAGDLVFEDQPGAFLSALSAWIDTPASRHLLDESALLSPDAADETDAAHDDSADDDSADMDASETDTFLAAEDTQPTDEVDAADAADQPIEPLTEEAPEAEDEEMPEAENEEAEPMVGTPGYVVPGVSDMGLDGLSVVTVNGVANIAPDASASPDDESSPARDDTEEDDDSAAALLPEASESSSRDESNPPTDSVANITDADYAYLEPVDESETPTEPRRVAQASATPNEPVAVRPELHTSAAARAGERAKSLPASSRQRGSRPASGDSVRAALSGRQSGRSPSTRGNAGKGANNKQAKNRSRADQTPHHD